MEVLELSVNSAFPSPDCGGHKNESEIVDQILATYKSTLEQSGDLIREGSLLVSQIARMAKDLHDDCVSTEQNGLLLLLALFFLREDQFRLPGTEIGALNSSEKATAFEDLAAVISY